MKRWFSPVLWILLGIALSAAFFLISSPPRGQAVELLPLPSPAPIYVDIHGAVVSPGVYTLPPESRVKDAIDAAGGMGANADVDAINQAARLTDGEKISVPIIGEPRIENPIIPAPERSSPLAETMTNQIININSATAEDLDSLPGIGPALAERIISYRESRGPFKKIEEIMDVSGIGEEKFEQMKTLITVE